MSASDPGASRLGLWSAIALVVGHTIAVGIFLTPAEVIGALAAPALTIALWVGCGALVLAGAFTYGELASRYPLAGGLYVYLREAWGERIAFLYGWQSLVIMDPGITAALATGLSGYVVLIWPDAAGSERWLAVATIWVLAAISIAGVTLSARTVGVMTAAKLLAFAAVILAALASRSGSWSNFEALANRPSTAPPLAEAVVIALVSIFFSFGGFWEAARIAGEVRHASRVVPIALAIGVACVTVVYVATTAAFIYLVPVEQASNASEFARRAGEALLGPAGPTVLAWIVVLSVVSSLLALLIVAPRLYVAMSRDRLFPSALATLSTVTNSPVRATLLLAVLASGLALAGTFQQIVAFFMCTTLIFVALAAAALIVVRRTTANRPIFSCPAYPAPPVLFILFVVGIVVLVAVNRPVQAVMGFAIVLVGLAGYEVVIRRRRKSEAL